MSEGSEGLVKGEGFAVDASLVKADVNRQTAVPGNELSSVNWRDPKRCTRAVQEYLDGVDQANPIETVPKSVSLTDPCARWTATEGPAFFSYSLTYLNRIITSEHGGANESRLGEVANMRNGHSAFLSWLPFPWRNHCPLHVAVLSVFFKFS